MIKALTILLGCLALATTVHAHGGAKGNDNDRTDTPAELLAKYDKNGDGKLDASELAAMTSDDRAVLDRHRGHHGHPGRGKGGPGPGGKGDGRGDDADRGKGGPGPGGKGDGRGDDAGRGKGGPGPGGKGDGRGDDAGRGKGGPGGKGAPGGKGKAN